MQKVILVDEKDQEIGSMEKLEAHQKGLLHRAISVIIYNSNNELLLQQRALSKYHSPGLWTNTCCSHPMPGEDNLTAASRRLEEEMGITCELKKSFDFIYKSEFENGLTEYEFDHVFIGYSDEIPRLNPEEALHYKYLTLDELKRDLHQNPQLYTTWFKIICEQI